MTVSVGHDPIVAGVDGSASALHAVRWAAREAARYRVPLRLVHVSYLVPEPPEEPADDVGWLIEQRRQWLAQAADAARAVAGEIEIGTELRGGTVAKALVEESAAARLIVLGERGLEGFADLLLGSVPAAVAAHARCPVVVIRSSTMDNPPPADGPVVVGVDGSELSDAAVGFAFAAASARGVPLVAVHAWLDVWLAGAWTPVPMTVDWERIEADEHRVLAERLAGWRATHPGVEVRSVVVPDRPATALLDAAGAAQLLVVGSHGRGALASLGLGSVSHTLLQHAPCPVAIVRTAVAR